MKKTQATVHQSLPQNQYRAGMTLVETILYFGLLSFFLVSVLAVFNMVLEAQLSGVATAHVEQSSQYLLARITHDIRSSDQVQIPATAGAETQELQLVRDGEVLRYFIDGTGALALSSGGKIWRLLGSDMRVTTFRVKRIEAENGIATVQFQVVLESTVENPSGSEAREYQATVSLR